jgi:YidC/Oxa1 family membrane protein insertase
LDKELQRNLLIAIVLSMLIMLVWTKFFAPKLPVPPEKQAIEQQAAVPGEEQPLQSPAEPGEAPAAEASVPLDELVPSEELAEARDVVVETTHMVATFSTLGGRLVSLMLPEYDSKRGGHVELVPPSDDQQWPLGLTFHDSEFGARTENFVYEHRLYRPGSTADAADADMRALLTAVASEKTPAADAPASNQADLIAQSTLLVFSRQMTPRLRLVKAFVFPPDTYSFDMHVVVRNTGDASLDLGAGRSSYTIDWLPGIESSETNTKYDELVGVHLVEKNFGQKAIRKLKETREFSENLTWIGLKRKYFFVAMEPLAGLLSATMEPLERKAELVDIKLDMGPIRVQPGAAAAQSVRLSVGPMLKDVLTSLGPGFGQILNFGFFDLFAKPLVVALLWFNDYVQNYGLAIILLTIVVRVGLFPLNQKSYRSMKEMQALQPLVTELREKHKKNPQEMNKKMMELYRAHKVNPMGGCLPIAFQMPVFIALFQALKYAVELRGAHFLWIVDLSEPDRLFTLTVPINLSVNLLPLLVIVAMLVQQKMTPMAGAQSEGQQKMMQYMPVIFGFLFYSMPSGLTVYFLVSTVLGLVQQYFVQKAA